LRAIVAATGRIPQVIGELDRDPRAPSGPLDNGFASMARNEIVCGAQKLLEGMVHFNQEVGVVARQMGKAALPM